MSEQLNAIERLISLTPQPRWQTVLKRMHDQLTMPMQDVLEKVPGEYVRDKILAIGCKRTTFYNWLNESYRPGIIQAKRLAELTGLPWEQIRGREYDIDPGRAPPKTYAQLVRERQGAPEVHGRAQRVGRGMGASQVRSRGFRTLRKRIKRGHGEGEDGQP